jgi:DNA-binding CsgD family transcriptional regulator
MARQAEKTKKRSTPEPAGHTPVDLIRLLVHLASTQEPRQTRSESEGQQHRSEEIILEADLDGARYVLIRLGNASWPRAQLSPREQEIVRMVASGHSNKVIAEALSISAWTVCTHLRRIFAKLGVGSRAAMVARLFEIWGIRERSPAVSPSDSATAGDAPKDAMRVAAGK